MMLPVQVNTAISLLESAGFEAYVVGGAVRDHVRSGFTASDWDVTTNALPEQVKEVFRSHRLIETGLQHGTVTAIMDGTPIEITTYRIDGDYADNRHPYSVIFTQELLADLERRDFTMNALAYNPKTGIVDPFGGIADIKDGLIRCVGNPDRRFREDGLRILRALRFSSVLGMQIEAETAAAVHRNRDLLKNIAAERIQAELTKLLCGVGAADILRGFSDVIAVPLPEIAPTFGFDQRNRHHNRDIWEHTIAVVTGAPAEPVLRWSALLHDLGKPSSFTVDKNGVGHFYGHGDISTRLAENILARLRFDTARKERIVSLVRYHDCPITADKKLIKRLLSKHGVEAARQLIELHKADSLGQAPEYLGRIDEYNKALLLIDEILQEEACFSLRDLSVNGSDLLALGLKGKAVGTALDACLEAVIEDRIPNEREALLNFVSKLDL